MTFNFIFENLKKRGHQYHEVEECSQVLSVIKKHEIDFVIIDYASCRFDICREIKKIKKIFPETIFVVFNFDHSEFEKVNLLKAGVNALLPLEAEFATFLILLRDLKSYEIYFNRLVDKDWVRRIKVEVIEDVHELTMQEISFIRDRCNGMDNASIAKKFNRSGSRIDNVFHDIRVKTGCESQIDFIRFAMLHRIIDWNSFGLKEDKKYVLVK